MIERFQLQRGVLGWRMPDGGHSCARPHRWGNPYRVGYEAATAEDAVRWYREALFAGTLRGFLSVEHARRELGGYRALGCFCPPDRPCHVDVLIEVLTS